MGEGASLLNFPDAEAAKTSKCAGGCGLKVPRRAGETAKIQVLLRRRKNDLLQKNGIGKVWKYRLYARIVYLDFWVFVCFLCSFCETCEKTGKFEA